MSGEASTSSSEPPSTSNTPPPTIPTRITVHPVTPILDDERNVIVVYGSKFTRSEMAMHLAGNMPIQNERALVLTSNGEGWSDAKKINPSFVHTIEEERKEFADELRRRDETKKEFATRVMEISRDGPFLLVFDCVLTDHDVLQPWFMDLLHCRTVSLIISTQQPFCYPSFSRVPFRHLHMRCTAIVYLDGASENTLKVVRCEIDDDKRNAPSLNALLCIYKTFMETERRALVVLRKPGTVGYYDWAK